ncbi:MAG TPA: DNA polymerase III subunit beta [Firmicutes bacterium]|nr:DNA polymerase III subunit beta [Bacillota bacterium]HBS92916.1 DNA polymerase III subunit beta [Bacillota bacterium]HCX78823.1 DNA polymerase III subunit beta [Bacillota bacterium]
MRLTQREVEAIKDVIGARDEQAQVYLFGSRAYDDLRGGDIDLLVITQKLEQNDVWKLKYALWERIGEQKIDIVVAQDDSHPFVRIALKEGVLL